MPGDQKTTVVLFGANDYIPVDISHTGFWAKDIKLEVPSNPLTPTVTFSLLQSTVTIRWGSCYDEKREWLPLQTSCKFQVSHDEII